MDMSAVLLEGKPSPREEIVVEVSGSVRLPTLRKGDFKLVGKELFNLAADPYEKTDIAAENPKLVAEMSARLKAASAERPPLGDLPLLMDPALPYVYGRDENPGTPDEIKAHVEAIRAKQPRSYPEGTYPWPGAPKDGKVIYTGDGR